ncbi:hypothetical protein BVRB_010770 [Beta vulgaris subsp. vulgaris]|uniref:Uncharacterized protein n=1 Tax=Beta vulgaris subsp. vulgaris TaxID=3555 RepID=A0A0J8B2A6_BETVV|nr:hypothetical protein BVRB_010770 [Beta vulgaris subsp. vulgaris]
MECKQNPRVNRKLDLHWISPESPHLSYEKKFGFKQALVRTRGVRHANVPWMIHIPRSDADGHIGLSMWLRALTAQAQRCNYQGCALPLS